MPRRMSEAEMEAWNKEVLGPRGGTPDSPYIPRQFRDERNPYWTAQRCWDGVTRYRPGRADYSEVQHQYDPFAGLKSKLKDD
jgi:hypothetical protein